MPKRRLPSPEAYGRQLAEARRRDAKQRETVQKQVDQNFQDILDLLERHMTALEALGVRVASLDKEVLSPPVFEKATEAVLFQLAEIQAAIASIDLDIPAPDVPEFPVEVLDEAINTLRGLANTLKPLETSSLASITPAESILSGPVTLKVTERDANGDIESIRVEPTRH